MRVKAATAPLNALAPCATQRGGGGLENRSFFSAKALLAGAPVFRWR